ncbi:hypothetical protein ACP4OV_017365 [Aristida adscensionis]
MAMAMAVAPASRSSDDRQAVAGAGEGGGGDPAAQRRERMFEKVVTPSDVGKLNRLVVPKHFAEKYLPLPPPPAAAAARAAAAGPAGTVLCFHDARGRAAWRFRYSYWSSSQSYVMTKGWSRYVRDKRLAAGDTVSFCRDGARLFIDCRRRRRPAAPAPAAAAPPAMAAFLPPASCRVVVDAEEAQRGRRLRLFGVDLELRAGAGAGEPLLLDLQL